MFSDLYDDDDDDCNDYDDNDDDEVLVKGEVLIVTRRGRQGVQKARLQCNTIARNATSGKRQHLMTSSLNHKKPGRKCTSHTRTHTHTRTHAHTRTLVRTRAHA